MKIHTATLAANVARSVPLPGRYFRILNGVGIFDVEFSNGVRTDFVAGLGVALQDFESLTVVSPTDQVVMMAVSNLPIDDNRLAGEIALSGTLNTVATPRAITRTVYGAHVAISSAATILIGYEVERAGVLIQNLSTGPIYYGTDLGVGVTSANGLRIDAGGSFETKYNGLILLRGTAASQDVRFVAEYFE